MHIHTHICRWALIHLHLVAGLNVEWEWDSLVENVVTKRWIRDFFVPDTYRYLYLAVTPSSLEPYLDASYLSPSRWGSLARLLK